MRSKQEEIVVSYADKKTVKYRDMKMHIGVRGDDDPIPETTYLAIYDKGMRIDVPLMRIVEKIREEAPWLN